MADNVIGNAYINVKPKVDGGFESEISAAGSGGGNSFGGAFAVAAGNLIASGVQAAASAAIGIAKDVVGEAFSSFAEYEQLAGGVETIFGDASNAVLENAQNAFSTVQMSANDYLDTVTSFSASLIQSLGGDTQKATTQADRAIQDMSDNANKMGTDIKSIQNAYQGFAKGNYTMLDNLKLGYGGTQEEMKRLLADAEKLSGTHFEFGNFNDTIDAIHVIQESMGIAGSSAEEAKTTIEGSLNAARASWTNWLTELGKDDADMEARTHELVESIATAAKNIIPRVIQIGQELIANIPSLIAEVGSAIKENILPQLDEVTGGAASKIWESFEELFKHISDAVSKVMEHVGPLLEELIELLGPVLADVILPALCTAFDLLGDAISFVADIIRGIIDIVNNMIQAFKDAKQAVEDWAASNAGNAAQPGGYNQGTSVRQPTYTTGGIPTFASGGIVTGPTLALVGEAGPEMIVPLSHPLATQAARGGTTNINLTVNARTDDPDQLGRLIGDRTAVVMRSRGLAS